MSPMLGPATLQDARSDAFLPQLPGSARGEYSERTAQSIDEEVRRLLSEAERRVRATLSERRAQLDELARALLQHETIERSALLALLERVGPALNRAA
jgi:cell division protease FtsH